jgi:hypothetical protein
VRGDQVFGERFCATTDGITSTDDSFPDEDFFPDISGIYIDDMADTLVPTPTRTSMSMRI